MAIPTQRGKAKFDKLAALLPRLRGRENAGAALEALIKAALADEDGRALDKAIADLGATDSVQQPVEKPPVGVSALASGRSETNGRRMG